MEYMLRCELCRNEQPKQEMHICESGHIICVNCNVCPHTDLHNEYSHIYPKEKPRKVKKNNSRKEFAGGDNKQTNRKRIPDRSGSEENSEVLRSDKNETDFSPSFSSDMTLLYKNLNYTIHDKEEFSINNPCYKYTMVNNITEEKYTRPIVCPVKHCQRTIVLDSILKHFAFDHPKIATLTLETKKSVRIILKPYKLTTNTQCIAVINPIGIESPMLLMAAKILNRSKVDMDKEISEKASDSRIHFQRKNRRTRHGNNQIYFFSDSEVLMQPEIEMDIIIWICRLNNSGHLYSITVRREYALSYSYVGEGLHIQNAQDPINVYKSPESLIIRHHSIAKLQDDNSDLHVYICIIK